VKIVRIIARLNVGGPARHVALLNGALDVRGHRTLLVHGALDAGEASLEQAAHDRQLTMVREPNLGRRVRAGGDLRALISLVRILFREKPDIIHTHTAKAGTLGRLAAFAFNSTRRRSTRALVVHTFHGHVFEGYFSPLANRVIRLIERTLARITDIVVTISPRQRADIVHRFAVAPEAKTVVVPLGLDLERLLALPARHSDIASPRAGDGDVVIGFVGRLVPVKAIATALKAFGRAHAVLPSLRFVIAGDGPERAAATALMAELGLRDRVTLLGWVDDLPAFYASIDVLVLSSINEGTPVAVIEAMAAGRCVVATAVGGVPDVVDDGVTGVLVAANDPDAMAAALLRVASDATLRTAMGAAGRAKAAAYSYLRLADDIERLYERGLTAKRS
jgi:glycosyltransferase involved in cell wall biosynthesis